MSRKKLTQSIYKMMQTIRCISDKRVFNMGKGVRMTVHVKLSELNKFSTATLIRFSDLLRIGLAVQETCRSITHRPKFITRDKYASMSYSF